MRPIPDLMTPAECSRVCLLSKNTLAVRRSTGGNAPPFIKTGEARTARIFYKREDVLRWMAGRGMITAAELADALGN